MDLKVFVIGENHDIYIYVFFDCYISGLDKSKQNQTKLQFPSVVNKDLLGL